ncbi:MAG: hypothetical protein WED87_04080 [Dehalococcoidia bacterium]
MTMGDNRYGSGDPSSRSRVRPGPADLPGGQRRQTTSGGRRLGQLDNGTVALALSGMAYYWLMPMLLARRGPRRRTRRSRSQA